MAATEKPTLGRPTRVQVFLTDVTPELNECHCLVHVGRLSGDCNLETCGLLSFPGFFWLGAPGLLWLAGFELPPVCELGSWLYCTGRESVR